MENFLQDKRTVWIVAAVTMLLFLIANLPWQLDDYDQAKQAFTSFEMIKEGHWFYQRTPHEHVATKPPLVGWVSAGVFVLTKSWDVAWRLPSFLAAIGIMMLLFRAATSVYGSTGDLIALGAFGLNLLSPRLATLVRTDMPLALAVVEVVADGADEAEAVGAEPFERAAEQAIGLALPVGIGGQDRVDAASGADQR